jgi:hypothetical protein
MIVRYLHSYAGDLAMHVLQVVFKMMPHIVMNQCDPPWCCYAFSEAISSKIHLLQLVALECKYTISQRYTNNHCISI